MPETTDSKGVPAVTTSTLDAERTELLAGLAAARSALIAGTQGLTDEQAAEQPTVSTLCLGGLIKHVASMEDAWVRFIVEGPSAMTHELPEGVTWADFIAGTAKVYPQWAIDHEAEFQMQPGDTLAGVLARYERIAARTEEVVAGLDDLSVAHPLPEAPWHEPGGVRSARRVLTHLIAETAQHAGHADILRETIDSRKSS